MMTKVNKAEDAAAQLAKRNLILMPKRGEDAKSGMQGAAGQAQSDLDAETWRGCERWHARSNSYNRWLHLDWRG